MTGKANQRLLDALAFSVRAHGLVGQERKGTTFPYASHPIRVAEILYRFDYDEDVVVAGFLHDTIEDTDAAVETIRAEFGDRVANLVLAASEPDKTLPWKARKKQTIAHLRQEADSDARGFAAADKLDNIRSIADTLRHLGDDTWALFNAPKTEQHWYYRTIAEVVLDAEPTNALFRTLDLETRTLFPDPRSATRFFAGKPLGNPDDARAYLADPIKHWRPNHSALQLATSWINSSDQGGVPTSVRAVLDTCEPFAGCRLVEGLFEREVDLGTKGRPSQTDLLVLAELTNDGYGVIAVEGKAREPFGPLVSKWNDSPGKQTRLDDLCARLELDPSAVGQLRYQLLHRTVSALIEAKRYGAAEAMMLVHSFDPDDTSLGDYQAFAAALGLRGALPNTITQPIVRSGITLRLAWVKQNE